MSLIDGSFLVKYSENAPFNVYYYIFSVLECPQTPLDWLRGCATCSARPLTGIILLLLQNGKVGMAKLNKKHKFS